jgi:large subunit ribosomal protein L31
MKKDIHPNLNEVIAKCACGSSFQTITTAASIEVDICSQCHPIFTGEQRFVDTAGRIEKFQRRYKNVKGSKKDK